MLRKFLMKCDICPHNCDLHHNGLGFCGYRINNLGKFSAVNIDPIEKKPLYHVYPGSKTLSLGSIGCNLNCPWCQNWQISRVKINEFELKELKVEDLINILDKNSLDSVTFTYNEPTLSYEYITENSKVLKDSGFKVNIVTSGYISSKYLEPFYENIDAVNVDLKSFNHKTYSKIIGGDLDTVLETLKYLSKSHCWLEITTLLIPDLNDSTKEIDKLSNWIKNDLGSNIPLHFSAFHPCYKYNHKNSTPKETIFAAIDIAKKNGIEYIYPGNIGISDKTSTFCINCGNKLIHRDGYNIKNYLKNSNCPKCDNKLPGLFI